MAKYATQEFRLEAARLVVEGGVSLDQAARDLGINKWTLRRWVLKLESESGARTVVQELPRIVLPTYCHGWSLGHLPISSTVIEKLNEHGYKLLNDLNGAMPFGLVTETGIDIRAIEEIGAVQERLLITAPPTGPHPALTYTTAFVVQQLDTFMDAVGERNRKALLMRYSGEGREPATLEEIGVELGVSKERARQVINRSMSKADGYFAIGTSAAIHVISEACGARVYPVTPGLLEARLAAAGVRPNYATRFYTLLLQGLFPSLPCWPGGVGWGSYNRKINDLMDAVRDHSDQPITLCALYARLQAEYGDTLFSSATDFLIRLSHQNIAEVGLLDPEVPVLVSNCTSS